MFNEDIEAVAAANRAATIPSGDYEADITAVTVSEGKGDKFGQFIITFTLVGGDNEGLEYTKWLTQSPKASGVRAGFYRNIGYTMPEDGVVDENDWVGLTAKINLKNDGGSVSVNRIGMSDRKAEDTLLDGDDGAGASF